MYGCRSYFRLLMAAVFVPALAGPVHASGEVNVYSYRQPFLVEPLLQRFEADTGIKANVLTLDKGLVERIRMEGPLSPADVILTVDIGRLANAVEQGVTQEVRSAAIDANVPASLRDPDGHWIGLTTRARIVYASRERVLPGEVTTYENLASSQWKGRVCTRSGLHRYNIALISAVIEHHGAQKAEEWLRGLKANLARRPQGNDRGQVKAIWAGECDIAIGNSYYMGSMLENDEQKPWANAVRVEFPRFENGGTHVNLSGVAMARHAPNADNARRLIDFLVSETAQQIYAETNHEYPVKAGVPVSPTVASWGSFTPDRLSLDDIARRRAEAVRIVERVGYDE